MKERSVSRRDFLRGAGTVGVAAGAMAALGGAGVAVAAEEAAEAGENAYGLACDTTGTLTMSNIASQSAASGFGIHAITGVVAIVLMLVHALWATFTYKRGSQQARRRFHTFSTVVWLAWLVPYIIGMLVGIPAIHLQAVCAIGTSVIIVAILAVILFAKGRKKNDRGGKSRGTSPHAISH